MSFDPNARAKDKIHVRAAGMPEHIRRDVRQRLIRMQLLILLCPAHFILDVQSGLRTVVLVQHDEAVATVYHKMPLISFLQNKGNSAASGQIPGS